eukprot:scpid34954/ scgid18041/ Alpha-protein kinase vwkA; von Willebrand factor A alpha-kinase
MAECSESYDSEISVHGSASASSERDDYMVLDMLNVDEDAGTEVLDDHLDRELEGLTLRGPSVSSESRVEERRLRHAHFDTPAFAPATPHREPAEDGDSGLGSVLSTISLALPECDADEAVATVLAEGEGAASDSVTLNRWIHEGGEETASRLDVANPINVNLELSSSDQTSVLASDGSGTRPEFKGNPGKRFVRVKTSTGLSTVKEVSDSVTAESNTTPTEISRREELRRERMQKLLEEKKAGIEELNRLMRLAQSVDVCFMVDSTGSMQSWIDGVKKNIHALYDRIQKVYKKSCHMRAAFIAYTDFDVAESERVKVFEFNLYPQEFYRFVDSVKAHGGGDTAEDIMGAFHAMFTKLSWRPDVTKLLIHIADAPCHGKQYHNGVSDSNPEGDPNRRTHDEMMRKMAENKIQYFFGKINDSTDKMIGIFEQALQISSRGDLSITTFSSVDPSCGDFLESLETAIKCSVQHSMAAAHCKTERPECRLLDKTLPKDFHGVPDRPGTAVRFHMPKSIDALMDGAGIQIDKYKVIIRAAARPFAKGSARLAFHGVERVHKKRVVLKSSKFEEVMYNRYKRYLEDAEVQTVAAKFLSDFKKALPAPYKDRYRMHMIVSKVVAFDNAASEGTKYMAMEPLLPPADYEKFTNNYDVQPSDTPFLETLQALSHWSWVISKERMMLVDLQGVPKDGIIYLTDPAIHSKNLLQFGYGTNLGVQGMIKFFEAHRCNDICRAFGFKPNPMV